MNKILQQLHEDVNTVEASLHGYLDVKKEVPQPLFDSVKYSLYAGGKRIRPALVLAFCRLFGGEESAAIPFACAIEAIHTYSLIHDDLPCMDDDDIRRGKATNHRMFGEATALLAGDGLLTFAFELMTKPGLASADQTLIAIRTLSECAGIEGMVGGQQLDLNGEKQTPDEETVYRTHRMKTGALIRAACLLGCCAAGKAHDRQKWEAAQAYGAHLGMAFQIMDDVLDANEPQEVLGTVLPAENDPTSVIHFMTKEEAKAKAAQETAAAIEAIAAYPDSEYLIGLANRLAKRTH